MNNIYLKAFTLIFWALTLGVTLVPQKVWPFTLSYSNEAHFSTNQITVDVAGDGCSLAGFNSANDLLTKVVEAMDEYWNRIPTCALELSGGSVRSGVSVASDPSLSAALAKANENTILVGCSTNTSLFGAGTLAIASIDPNNSVRGAVLINNTDSSFANLTEREKLATLAHEVGHALGIGHSANPTALMYYSIGAKIQEKLSIDDYDACTYLYPHEAPGSCSSVALIDSKKNRGGGSDTWGLSFLLAMLVTFLVAKWPSRLLKAKPYL